MGSEECKNCGGWKGIHRWDDLRCPRDGREAPAGREQLYENTVFRGELTDTEQKLIWILEDAHKWIFDGSYRKKKDARKILAEIQEGINQAKA